MAKLTDETRHRLATGWDPRVCTLREYARQNSVSERAIRLWRSQMRHEDGMTVPGGKDAVPLQAAVDALQRRLAELEAAVDAALAAAAAARATLDDLAARRDVPGGTETADDVAPTEPEPVERKPMPPPGFFWG